ncbi:MAG: cell division protein FtsA [Henriciella sp.]|nr:cell division protein FtsA [Henriciella sp.]
MSTSEKRLKPKQIGKAGTVIASLDIGCSKIACLIGRVDPGSRAGFAFMGGGRQQSRGFNGGSITNMDALERSVRLAVEDAEREAGERIEKIILGITGPKVESRLAEAQIDLGQREISSRDVQKVWAQALGKSVAKEQKLLGAYPVMYGVDDQDDIRDPIGMIGNTVRVLLNVVTAPRSLVDNLTECLSRAHLEVEQIVPSALASGSGSLIDDEVENGAICVDFGGGVTSVSVFLNGAPAWLDLVKLGGANVTGDIAQGIGTTFAAAERLKTVYGTADLEGPGLAERIEAPRLGDDGRLCASRMARGDLASMIVPRVEEVFEIVKAKLIASELRPILPRRTVLTGGASQLPGARDLAAKVLNQPVRLGRPIDADVLGENYGNPAFSTAAGLISYELKGFADASRAGAASALAGGTIRRGMIARVLTWIRENF